MMRALVVVIGLVAFARAASAVGMAASPVRASAETSAVQLTRLQVSQPSPSALAATPSTTDAVTELLAKIEAGARATQTSTLIIRQNGSDLRHSGNIDDDHVISVQSVTKSFAAIAIARLIEDGKIRSFDEPMSTWIPSFATDVAKSRITLRMILSHTSGYPDVDTVPDFFSQPDLVAAAVAAPLKNAPGSAFVYSSIASVLLEPVIRAASGETATAYLTRIFLAPAEITDGIWSRDHAGHEVASGGLRLSALDLLKLGEFLETRGSVRGHRVLSEASFTALVTKSQSYRDYGLMFWLSADGNTVSARGFGGQYVVVNYAKHVMAVRTRDLATADVDHEDDFKFWQFPDLIAQWP